jgi:hypothetical protein
MKDAQKPDHTSLGNLLNRLNDGNYVIPDFQREFEWEPKDIRDLVRSIFLDYYIGSLLLLKGKGETFAALSCEPIYGQDKHRNPNHIVLDGQQRLTAMHYAFTAPDKPLPNRSSRAWYWVDMARFAVEEFDEAFHYRWDSRSARKLFSIPELQYEHHVFPCSIVGEGGFVLFSWIQGYEQFWNQRAEAVRATDSESAKQAAWSARSGKHFGEHLHAMLSQYQISYIELDRDLEIDKVCDIFTQLNSKGVQLDIFDLMNALLKPKDLQLKRLWREASARLAFVESAKMNVYVLQVMSILRQAYCSPKYLYFLLPNQEKTVRDPDGTRRKEVLIADVETFSQKWDQAVDALESAIHTLRHPHEYGAVSPRFLPYVSILPVFASIQAHLRTLPAELQFGGQRKIRHWYWASVFDNRYSGSVESTSTRDFLDLREWFQDDNAKPALIREFESRLRDLEPVMDLVDWSHGIFRTPQILSVRCVR